MKADVTLDRVSVAYGEVTPIRELSLEVAEGELLALLGPSGCGKTTTLRVVAGFIRPIAGEVRVRGRSMTGVPAHHRNIGMVYQDYALFPHMTVRDNVAFGLRMRKVSGDQALGAVGAVIRQLQLEGLETRYPSQLSGGQQQRVALARALVISPAVLLLDEPLAALDKKLRAEMQFELRRLQRSVGITTIFVTHDQEEALSLSDRVAVLNQGRILQIDSPKEVYDRPTDRFVAEFIGTANLFRARVLERNGGCTRAALVADGTPCRLPVVAASSEVEFMVRPERMRLAPLPSRDTQEPCNRIQGRVVSSIFVGASLKYQVRLDSGQVIRVDAAADRGVTVAPDTPVAVTWEAEDARVLSGDPGP